MDLARRARKNGFKWNPMFVGAPGVGKSEIVQQWCKQNSLPFIDLRLAYMEACDLIGFPSVEKVNGRQVTAHNIPEFWPTEGEGVLLLEEPNRGNQSVLNACMQLLTDRKVHKYTLPEGWIIVSCINPEDDPTNDVNTMDTPLKDRFEFFYVNYDKQAFLEYMRENNYDDHIIMFVDSGAWQYSLPGNIKVPGAKYISPRTISKLNAAMKSDIPRDEELMVYQSVLGDITGKSFYTFKYEQNPVTYHDLVNRKKASLTKLKKFADPNNYLSGYIGITIRSIVEDGGAVDGGITDELLKEVLLTLPADQGPALLRELEFKRKDNGIFERMLQKYPELKEYFQAVLSYKKAK